MKEETMNMEALSRPELLTLLSILEGELEAQDVVVHALRAQHRDSFIQERYGQYDLSDPFLALQRDQQGAERGEARSRGGGPVGPDPRAVLRLVMAHCKRMQERMTAQLAAAQLRHRRVISDLEGEKRQHAQDLVHGAGVSSMLQNQRDQLVQQLEEERAKAAGRVQEVLAQQQEEVQRLQEVLAQQQEQQEALSAQLHRAEGRAQEEVQRVEELHARLLEERSALQTLQGALQEAQARTESQETRSHADREQMKARLQEEQERSSELERQLEELRRRLGEREGGEGGNEGEAQVKDAPPKAALVCAAVQTEPAATQNVSARIARGSKINGHRAPSDPEHPATGNPAENGVSAAPPSPLHPSPHPVPHSPSSTASSSLSSSPISSPVLAKRLGSPPGLHQSPHQSPYQASVTQRFQAARHKFQSQAELEQQHMIGSAPLSPRELSPTPPFPLPENSSAKQLARNTVAQVLSRFTSQQAGVKPGPIGSSPFGTDYRTLGGTSGGGRSPSSGPLSPGPRSPIPPRSGMPGPPPIAPKRPGMSPTPGSPTSGSPSHCARGPCARGPSVFPELTGSGPEESTEPDLVCSSGS